MNRIVLQFDGGPWDGRALCTDSPNREESLRAVACFETSHRGGVGSECVCVLNEEEAFARRHRWTGEGEFDSLEDHIYIVHERCETEAEIHLKLRPKHAGRKRTR